MLFFIHLKLELLAQFPASNDDNYLYFYDISGIVLFDLLMIYQLFATFEK